MTNYADYLKMLLPDLLAAGYRPANFKSLGEVLPSVLILLKQEGSVYYAINLYPLAEQATDFNALWQQTADGMKKMQARAEMHYLYVYNVLITEEPREDLFSFVTESDAYHGQNFYELNYAVVTAEGALYFAKNQPQDLTNTKKMLSGALTKKNSAPQEMPADLLAASAAYSAIKPKTQTPFLTYGILTVNLVLLLLLELSGGSENSETLMNFGAMNFQKFWAGDYYRVFAAMFLHIGAMHFVYNSLSLVIFGVRIERHYGRGTFLAVYIVTGLVGNYLNAMAEPQILLAGASGAIFGLMGAAVAITQYTKKYLDGLNLYTMLVFAFVGVSFGFLMPNVGNIAHIGGLASGYLMGMLILKIWGGHRSGENTANTQS